MVFRSKSLLFHAIQSAGSHCFAASLVFSLLVLVSHVLVCSPPEVGATEAQWSGRVQAIHARSGSPASAARRLVRCNHGTLGFLARSCVLAVGQWLSQFSSSACSCSKHSLLIVTCDAVLCVNRARCRWRIPPISSRTSIHCRSVTFHELCSSLLLFVCCYYSIAS